jgi:2-polyprenyl-6-methoxyphenol hydroxylase-like FAD-dependent oxidoreductase
VNTIIEACPDFKILNNPIKDVKPISSWTKGVSCLIGDAAHATTPNLGQGACQSIEDGLVLAACLAKYEDYETAFNAFQSLRMKKATWVVNQSWKVGKLSHLKNGLLVSLRNGVLKRIPKSFQRKQNGILFKLSKVD